MGGGLNKKLLIFGAGEFAMLARFYFERDGGRTVAAFVVDEEYLRETRLEGLPVVPFREARRTHGPVEHDIYVAISCAGMNKVRQQKFEECRSLGYYLPSYISTKATVWPGVAEGENCMILEQTAVQPTARIASNVLIGPGNQIGHRSLVRSHVYISSGVCIGGNCEIGERSFLGLSATIKDHCKVGADSFVTIGAVVVRDLPPGSVILAPKSSPADQDTAELVREQYFPDPSPSRE